MILQLPVVSVLVPARNEARTIRQTLESLANLDYPIDQLEILIGNDDSEDETAQIVADFIQSHAHFQLITIPKSKKKVAGKAGVLAILAQKAQGEFLFMTDADTALPSTWIKTILPYFEQNMGIITGFTIARPTNFFAKMQSLDWLIGLGLIQVASDLGLPMTSVGNNVAVRTEAYHQTGGYEKIPFSVTEDYALFQAIIKLNYGFKNLKNREVFAFTKPEKNLSDLLKQRIRWASGAMETPVYLRPFVLLYVFFGLILIGLCFINWKVALGLWLLKMGLQYSVAIYFMIHFRQFELFKWIPIYEFYVLCFNIVLAIKYFTSKKVEWKGKTYQK